ncbi:ubiquitin-like domain-containing protein [Georgenia sp. 10Sc9-8]|uniref:Ubiquitin-like domain-containing protein n=1 Tax=Georgenia halotolerans TaxID=3028317 RepID=A0ABT5TZY4_9MICO|nr:ubiquitin-like domain-containing protein [Georgenia halotolerans]
MSVPSPSPVPGVRLSRRRLMPWLALGLVPVVVGGSAVAAQAHKNVELEVDGESRQVSTYAGSVAGLLAEEGIDVEPHDVVAPGPDSPLSEGSDVVVQTAHPVRVDVGGRQREIWTTAQTAGEILAESGRDVTIASRSLDRAELDLPLVVDGEVLVVADGETTRVELEGAGFVADALAAAEVTVSDTDRVEIGAAEDGTVQVIVTRVSTGTRTETQPIEFRTVRREDGSLYEGQTRVVQEGKRGTRTVEYRTLVVDGEEVWAEAADTKVTEAAERIVAVGTAERPAPPARTTASAPSTERSSSAKSAKPAGSSSGSSSSGSSSSSSGGSASSAPSGSAASSAPDTGSTPSGGVWAKLAQCESGGDPTVVSANGLYYGLYQFTVGTWQSVGGTGLPSQASPAEQTKRAQMLQQRSGWGQWPHCSSVLGLR